MKQDNGNHAAHTPGNWWIDEMPGKFRVIGEKRKPLGEVHMRFGADVCEVHFADDGDTSSPLSIQLRAEAQADARLIAAAPALAEALLAVIGANRALKDTCGEQWAANRADEAIGQAHAAIAKSKGVGQ